MMNDYRSRISSSAEFDDHRYWCFERDSRLPWGYFDRPRLSADALVVIVSVVGLVIGLLVAR